MASVPPALGAGAEGAHLLADRRDDRGADDLAARNPWRRAQLDHRYCWMRDATFTLWGLHALDLDWEANDFMEYLADLKRNDDGSLQIMYGIGGERNLRERTVRHLKGYEGSRPVRVGNGAYNQRQNDCFGAVLDSVYLHTKRHDHMQDRLWPVLCDQVASAWRVCKRPDQGIGRRAASRATTSP